MVPEREGSGAPRVGVGMRSVIGVLALTLSLVGCSESRRGGLDAGPVVSDAGPLDAGPPDGGPAFPPGTTCTPGYVCPDGAEFSYVDGIGYCHWAELELPSSAGLEPYCFYFDDGYLGFSWPIGTGGSYECPPGARRAPSSELDYCLYEDLTPPAGAMEDCAGLVSERRLGFRWTCP